MVRLTLATSALLCWASLTTATSSDSSADDIKWTTVEWTTVEIKPSQTPSTTPVRNELTSHGCYGALPENARMVKGVSFLSSSPCWLACRDENKPVMILHATICYCADTYPSEASLVDDKKCDYGCPGYSGQACGGLATEDDPEGTYSVFNTGVKLDVDSDESDGSSNKSTKTSASAKVTATSTGSKSSSNSESSSDSFSSHSPPPSAVSDSTSASKTTGTPTQASSTPSRSTVGESSGIMHQSSLMHISAWLLFIFAI